MAGRQAHGRAITAKSSGKNAKKPKTKKTDASEHRARALDAYTLASAELPVEKEARGPRHRNPDIEDEDGPRPKHSRDSDEEGGDSEDEGPRRKKARPAQQSNEDGSEVEYGSDGEGNEWRVGAIGDDDDSEIDSDEAFGESDLEDFDGYAFRGSKSNKKTEEDGSEDEDDDESLGDDAIDLATALDQADQESEEDAEEGSDDDSDDDEDDDSDSAPEEEEDDSDNEEVQDKDALKSLVADFAGVAEDDGNKSKRQKIDLKDLALTGLNDVNMRKSLKLMSKEEKELRPGSTKKLIVPLAKRQQDRVLRKAAYEKTTETLDRWTDTIKHNRRAEHLVFPLPQDLPNAVLNNPDMQPLKATTATSELEKTMFSLLEQSGLSLEKEPKKPKDVSEEEFQQLSKLAQKELLAERRLERETQSREGKRASRLKKIKSKSYHRVHRRQKQKEEMATREAMEAAGEIDSEEEREAQDRIRALERVGQRHKNSSWAKAGSKVKRAVWDDDYRAGLTDMARRDEELRRRVEGRGIDDDSEDESSDSGSESEGERERLKRQLEKAAAPVDDAPQSGLMGLKFMRKEEERRKLANDELVKQIKKDLDSDNDVSEEEEGEVGRRKFGMGHADSLVAEKKPEKRKARKAEADGGEEPAEEAAAEGGVTPGPRYIVQSDSIGGAWSKGETRRKSKKKSGPSTAEPLDVNSSILLADVLQSKPNKSKSKPKPKTKDAEGAEAADSDEGEDVHLPLAIRDQELIARAFAGDDVVAQFEEEKDEIAVEQADKVVDNTLPGWGSWGGEGIAKGNRKRHLTKIEGVKRKDRQDAKLEKVIINEKKVKKNDRYLASHLPHQYESQAQYEGTLRLPVGKDFVTKETFQAGTKPRVIIKQGIIAPMSRPVV